jgi:AbrB family looped-hinge helix DNA binding protein
MRATIYADGRFVIPKPIRDEAGLADGAEVDVEFRDGRIEIVPVVASMRVVTGERGATIAADGPMPTLTSDDVRNVLERARR